MIWLGMLSGMVMRGIDNIGVDITWNGNEFCRRVQCCCVSVCVWVGEGKKREEELKIVSENTTFSGKSLTVFLICLRIRFYRIYHLKLSLPYL